MSRGRKIAAIIGGSLLGLVLLVAIGGIVFVQTDRFRNMVREKIIVAVEDATGGKVDLGSFAFDWHHLRADIHNFVIHGLEPAGANPLLRANLLRVELKLLSPFKGFVDIAYLLVDTPQANIMVFPDGRTNIPAPKIPPKHSDKTGLETVVDLAIRKFDLVNATAWVADQPIAINATAENLRAHLSYNMLNPSYTGELDLNPLILRTDGNAPLNVNVKLPITMEKDKITLANAELNSPQSKIVISGAMEHLIAPRTSAHINAEVALEEVRRVVGLTLPLDTKRGPGFMKADITASADDQRVQITSARVTIGGSNIEASGTLKDPNKPGSVQFNANLALGEIGRLLRVSARPEGNVKIGGNAILRQNNDYLVTANMDARNVAIHQGDIHLTGVNLDSSVTADPHRIELGGMRLTAMGGGFTGSGFIENMDRFRVAGTLHNFDTVQIARALNVKPAESYDGVISGPLDAEGSLKNTSSLVAKANLGIAPGRRGIPLSGRLQADYNAKADTILLGPSYLVLPHTRADLSGSLGKQVQVRVVSHDLADFKPLGAIPVTIQNSGAVNLTATVSGSLSAPRIAAHAQVTNFAVDGRPFTSLAADLQASKTGATLANGVLVHGPLQAQFAGSVGLRNWKPENFEPVRLDATVRNADLADVLALAGQSSVPATGALTADAHIAGTVGSPTGNADLAVLNGTVDGERFDSLNARAVLQPQSIDVPSLTWIAGPSRLDATASYQHAVNDLSRGSLRAHVASNQVQLAQFQSLVKDRPGLQGLLTLNADANANVVPTAAGTDIQVTNVNGNLAVRNLQMEGKALGDLTATANTAGNAVQYNVNSDFAGSSIRVNGSSLLTGNHDTTANALIANLPIDRVLAVAGRRDLPVSGTLGANAQVSGTLQAPNVTATLNVAKGSAWQEPFDRLQANIGYTDQSIDLRSFRLDDGPSYIEANGTFHHPSGDLEDGQVTFHARSNDLQLSKFHTVQEAKPGLGGIVQIVADGAATLRRNAAPLFSSLNANVAARGLSVNQKALGDLNATATTQGGAVAFNLTSDLAHANIHGSGTMQLTGDYPLNARLTFANLTYAGLSPLLNGTPEPFDASADGEVTVAGPVTQMDALRASLNLSKLQAHSTPSPNGRKPRVNFELHNDGPIVASLDKSVVTIQSAKIAGPFTNLTVTGTAAIAGNGNMNLRADGNIKLEVLEAFDPDIFSAGNITLNAVVTGTTAQPIVNGRLQLQNASLNMIDVPNGLSNANGTVTFNGTQATIQNITGETGGGKITLAGFVAYGGPEMQFRLQANADQIHVDYPQTVTTEATARLTVAGTTSRSLASGNVTILDVAMHSHSDIGSMLTSAATPPPAATASTGLLAGMHFDIHIQTAPDVQFHTTLTQNLQADANLTLRGTPDHPGMLGRLVVTQGDVIFFGTKYTIDQGTVAFYNPQKINPVLNIDLETTVQGVDVSLSVTGPMDRMKLSYRSDPPMQFSDLVSLVTSGKPPTTDPVLAARQPVAQSQSFQQVGASAVLSQAVANPVSGRLQRLFGVSKFKIDPQITGTSNTPQATMTLQQQITRDVTFTYIQDITQSNPQIIRMEWAISPQFSAIAQRDLNGIFDLDFFYKKRFH